MRLTRITGRGRPTGIEGASAFGKEQCSMMALLVIGKLLLGVASAGFGASLGLALKNWLDQREQVGD